MKSVTFVMDPIASIKPYKDSSFAVMLEAQAQGMTVFYVEPQDVFLQKSEVLCRRHPVTLFDDNDRWYELGELEVAALANTDAVFMRKDPPFDMNYIFLTYLLELVEQQGTLVINKPQSLRDCNEKLFTAWFPQCCPETLVTSQQDLLNEFLAQQQEIIVKPLDGMGGDSIFYVAQGDKNKNVIFDHLTQQGQRLMMAQKFIPEIVQGDKRIILLNGEPAPYALARIPKADDVRANLAAGGSSKVVPLTDRDRWLCQQVGPVLREKGLYWVGLDVIGDYITEINVTSPTCLREITASDAKVNLPADVLQLLHQ